MKRKYSLFLTLALFLCCLIGLGLSTNLTAATTMHEFLYDDADILDDREEADVRSTLEKYSKSNKIDIVIITTNDTNGVSCAAFGNTFMERSTEAKDYVVMVVSMEVNNRYLNVNSVGKCEKYISSKRCTAISETIKPYMKQGEYKLAFEKYAHEVDYYMHHKYSLKRILIELVIGIVIGLISIAIMVGNASGKKTTNCNTYLDASNSRVLAKRDRYIRTTVSKHKIEKSSSSSSSGGGGGGGGTKGNNGGCSF